MHNYKLLPCPFCGKKPNICDNVNPKNPIINDKTRYAVRCSDGCFAITNKYKTQAEAIEAWNTRKPMERIVEQLEKNGQKMSEAKAIRPCAKCSPSDHRYYKAISVKKAVDIVRKGGVDNAE